MYLVTQLNLMPRSCSLPCVCINNIVWSVELLNESVVSLPYNKVESDTHKVI